jgi:hypothetical protein
MSCEQSTLHICERFSGAHGEFATAFSFEVGADFFEDGALVFGDFGDVWLCHFVENRISMAHGQKL